MPMPEQDLVPATVPAAGAIGPYSPSEQDELIQHASVERYVERRAAQAYLAYRAHTGGVSIVTRQCIPLWSELPHTIKEAWRAAVRPMIEESVWFYLTKARAWSGATFGPGHRTAGVVDHIRKELVEIEASPQDLREWTDVVILALDGFWRAGGEPDQLEVYLHEKLGKNMRRLWPDWRSAPTGQAIEHVRGVED